MEIHLKDTLRLLRRKKNITQETLANYLGITPQSVGKWERGEGFPDITMLPKIALYFDVTVDELLDVGQARIDKSVMDYMTESMEYKNTGENEKNLALWERAHEEFPNDCRVMVELMHALNGEAEWPCFKETAARIISLGEQVLQKTNDTMLRESAISKLCYTYKSLGNEDKAIYYADQGGSFYSMREHLRSFVREGEEGVEASQQYICCLIEAAARTAVYELVRKGTYTEEEKIHIYEFSISLMKLLFSDNNAGFYANYISQYCSFAALRYAASGNEEKTLAALEDAVKYAIMAAEEREGNYTAPLVNRLKHEPAKISQNYRGNACDLRLNDLKRKEYDFVRDNKRFLEVEKALRRNAQC